MIHLSSVRHIPEWFPGAGFKRQARKWAPKYTDMVGIPLRYVKQCLVCPTTDRKSLCAHVL